ncbi:MAG: DEAD/DEAH box helicase [Planctomycetota bacterium]
MKQLGPATRAWFEASFRAPTEVQERGWAEIAAGRHALLVAPTGSGKTLAAFLHAIDRMLALPPDAPRGVRCVYVSPLKALVADVERNLRAPLAGIRAAAGRRGEALRDTRVDLRTGDTPQKERQRQTRDPGEILVTTPESLFLILGSRQRQTLATVTTVIVDEIHALAPTKRGVHLALSLERLAALTGDDPQRIGLSATVRPLDDVARFLGGDRPVEIVDASGPPNIALSLRVPVPDMENVPPPPEKRPEGGSILGQLAREELAERNPGDRERGLWPAIYPQLLDAIRSHRSTILFVNSRGLCERLVQRLNELGEEELVLAHHGSVSHAKRAVIEDALKRGEVKGIVATSSLELGIDMGAVDQVLLVESPGSVARGLQRVGRAGHSVGETSRGVVFPKFKGDLLEAAVVAQRMLAGEIEALSTPSNCLDVLAQQLVAMCCDRESSPEDLHAVVRRARPYGELSRKALESVLDMLSGRYPSTELADLRPRLRWDRAADVLSARPGAAMTARMNAGTIPDRGAYSVHVAGGAEGEVGQRIGELDEEMVFETRGGDTFLLGASTWRVESIDANRVLVSPAPGEPGRLPFWRGDGPGRPIELGRAIGAFVREHGHGGREHVAAGLRAALPLDENASINLADYLVDQREHCGALPTDRAITVERFRDELGDWRVCILTPFGTRVHAPWAMVLERSLSDRADVELSLMYCDDGIVMRFADTEEQPATAELFPDPEDLEELLTDQLGGTSLFASLFRENAVRSLLVTRRRPDQRSPLWAQRRKARELLGVVRKYPSFPIVLETYRQAMNDVFDLAGLRAVLRGVRERSLRVDDVETARPSPFARSVVFAYVAAYLYDGDSPVAERKAQALTLDREMLRELLGQAELRELLDGDVIDSLEAELAGLAPERRARDRDELADLLRRVGDLTEDEAAARATDPQRVAAWLAELEAERRAVRVSLAGDERWIAAEEAGVFRDAFGCTPPSGLPSDFLDGGERPFEAVLRRFARTRGPFHARDFARRYGLVPAQVEPALRALEAEGVLTLGELRPGGTELEWCDSEVLRRIKRRTLARLRDEVAPVDAPTFARFLQRWQGVAPAGSDSRGPTGERLEEVLAQLEGLPMSWSELSQGLLPARVPGFRLDELDLMAAQGRVVWLGRGALGPSDGRIALFRRERVDDLVGSLGDYEPPTELHAALLDQLERGGASFLTQLESAVLAHGGIERGELEAALWDLVWAGRVTNDTFQPLRTIGGARPRGGGRRSRVRATLAGGRWSLVSSLLARGVSDTERSLARVQSLLERYGVVSREAAVAEEIPGGWGPLYRVLRTMEESGRVRRGYFVEGLSGAQFASPGAADRLRAERLDPDARREPVTVSLAATDPANPWGSLLAWPERKDEAPAPRRARGARVVLCDGRAVLFAPPGGRKLTTFGDADDVERALLVLAENPRALGRRWLVVGSIDGVDALHSEHARALERSGYVREPKGYAADPQALRRAKERKAEERRA